ncbi:MAG: glycosyltransferase [Candidatus Rokubacteria bacterium]|nr:glycosyltransferase [Candidatus Rokubacteria bacterium]
MSVLFVIDNLEFGGGERGFLQLVRALTVESWPVGVASQPGGVFEAGVREAGAVFFPLDMTSRLGVRTILRLRRIVVENGFRIVHSQGARADFLVRLALWRLGRVRHVCTLQMPVEGFNVGPIRRALYQVLDRLTARRVDRFIVVSRALQSLLVDRRGVAPARVRLIPNGVEIDDEEPAPRRRAAARAVMAALGLASDTRLVGAVGRLVWQKGFEDLIRAMPAVVRAVPAARLVIAGEGPLRARLDAVARECGVADHVALPGFRADAAEFVRALEILVIPSRREGFPMVTLEAMALGTPVVATAIDGIVEQIAADVDGLLVPPGDPPALGAAIARLLGDPALRARLAAAAHRTVMTKFDSRKTVEDIKRLYGELLAGDAAGAGRAR